jgi:hypothetical protein
VCAHAACLPACLPVTICVGDGDDVHNASSWREWWPNITLRRQTTCDTWHPCSEWSLVARCCAVLVCAVQPIGTSVSSSWQLRNRTAASSVPRDLSYLLTVDRSRRQPMQHRQQGLASPVNTARPQEDARRLPPDARGLLCYRRMSCREPAVAEWDAAEVGEGGIGRLWAGSGSMVTALPCRDCRAGARARAH